LQAENAGLLKLLAAAQDELARLRREHAALLALLGTVENATSRDNRTYYCDHRALIEAAQHCREVMR